MLQETETNKVSEIYKYFFYFKKKKWIYKVNKVVRCRRTCKESVSGRFIEQTNHQRYISLNEVCIKHNFIKINFKKFTSCSWCDANGFMWTVML
jgi:hypothetical protein